MDKIITEQAKEKGREDSFWYSELIATYGKFRLYAMGDIAVEFPDGNYEKDGRAVEYAEDLGFKDKDLHKLEWINNNWFEVGWLTDDNVLEFDCGIVAHDYDEAIQLLISYYTGEIA